MNNKAFEKAEKVWKKAWEAVTATPEYQARKEADKARKEAWEVVKKTPEYKVYDKKEEAYWNLNNAMTGIKEFRPIRRN